MREVEVPVLIVGGGGAGLTSSLLLSGYGVRSMLVSRYPGTSHLPKAHVLHQRTMEVFSELGVADDVLAASTPAENMRATAWYAGFAGPGEHGRRIGRMPCWGDGYRDPNWIRASPCRSANLPQIRLEPILRRHAEARPEADVRFGHELVSLEQDDDGVRAVVEDRERGERFVVRARFLLGCTAGDPSEAPSARSWRDRPTSPPTSACISPRTSARGWTTTRRSCCAGTSTPTSGTR